MRERECVCVREREREREKERENPSVAIQRSRHAVSGDSNDITTCRIRFVPEDTLSQPRKREKARCGVSLPQQSRCGVSIGQTARFGVRLKLQGAISSQHAVKQRGLESVCVSKARFSVQYTRKRVCTSRTPRVASGKPWLVVNLVQT